MPILLISKREAFKNQLIYRCNARNITFFSKTFHFNMNGGNLFVNHNKISIKSVIKHGAA